jgi:TPR repeat protein
MKRAILLAASISALGVAGAAAQDEPRLLGRSAVPPLSVRSLPAAPPVHKLSIGPLSAPTDETAISTPDAAPEASVVDASVEGLVRRANVGDAEANYRLGLKHLAGEGVMRDFVEAFARIRLAAEAGHPRAIPLFYTMGARLTAEEHGQAYLRTQQLRPAARAQR